MLRGTYDAALRELDDLFADLFEWLAERGELAHTIVVLTSDHGELLGEHHLLDHQYSLHRALTHVPLVVWAPGFLEPGESDAPVMTLDLYPTLQRWVLGQDRALGHGRLLTEVAATRLRLSEYPAIFVGPFETVRRLDASFDFRPWQRRIRALEHGSHKLIEWEDGQVELFDLATDPGENEDLVATRVQLTADLRGRLFELAAGLSRRTNVEPLTPPSEQEQALLEALGYASGSAPEEKEGTSATTSWKLSDESR